MKPRMMPGILQPWGGELRFVSAECTGGKMRLKIGLVAFKLPIMGQEAPHVDTVGNCGLVPPISTIRPYCFELVRRCLSSRSLPRKA